MPSSLNDAVGRVLTIDSGRSHNIWQPMSQPLAILLDMLMKKLATLLRRVTRRSPGSIAPIAPRPRRHSVSSCGEYATCPRRFRYSYVDRLPEDRPAPAGWRYGTVVHAALEAAYREAMAGKKLLDAAPSARQALDAAWVREAMPDDDVWRDRAHRMVHDALANDPLHIREIIGVEHGFRAEHDGVPFAGYADLVLRRDADTVEIVDHKVTNYARTPEQLAADKQLNLYGWFALQEWPGIRRVFATHHYPPRREAVTVELTRESMLAAVDELAEVAQRSRADTTYEPRPSEVCESCCWIARCPAWNVDAADANADGIGSAAVV